ncbi:MAG: site-2 protease family protein [Bryobacteraceae bacterium]
MNWSWKVAKVAGIEFRVHVTFLLLLGWVAAASWVHGRSLEAMLSGLLFIVSLFACVLLHELGHSMAARKLGIPTMDITLLPIGGVARLQRMPEKPAHELLVALAGPAVNVGIAAVLFAWLTISHDWVPPGELGVASGPFLERLLVSNVWLVLFNLIPAIPMDGGRVLRAILASRMEYIKATRIASSISKAVAVVFGMIGLFGNPMLLVVALFVWIGASQEAWSTQMKAAIRGTPIHAAMLTDFRHLEPGHTLADAVRMVLEGSQQDFPVVTQRRVVGILTRSDMLSALAEHGPQYPVTRAMRGDFPAAQYTEMLETAFERLHDCGCRTMAVVHEGRLIGLLTMENVGEYFQIRAAADRNGIRSGITAGLPRRGPAGSLG